MAKLLAGLAPRDGRRGDGRRGDGRRGHRIPHDLDVLLQHVWPSLNVVLQAYPWRRCLKEPSLLLHELLRRHARAANGSRAGAWLVREERGHAPALGWCGRRECSLAAGTPV